MTMDPNKPGAVTGLFKEKDYKKEAEKPKPSLKPFVRPPRPTAITTLTGLTDDMKLPKRRCGMCVGTGWMWLEALPTTQAKEGLAFNVLKTVRRWTLCRCMTRRTDNHQKILQPFMPKRKHKPGTPRTYRLKGEGQRHEDGEWLSKAERARAGLRERISLQIEIESKFKNLMKKD